MDPFDAQSRAGIAALVERAVTPHDTDLDALSALVRRQWPGRDGSTNPVARHWIRRWGPAPMTAEPHECSGTAICATCN